MTPTGPAINAPSFFCFIQAEGTYQIEAGTDIRTLEDQVARTLRWPKLIKAMDRRAQAAHLATYPLASSWKSTPPRRALVVIQNSGSERSSSRFGWLAASGTSPLSDQQLRRNVPPLWLLHHLPNMTAAHLAREYMIEGPVHSLAGEDQGYEDCCLLIEDMFSSDEADEVALLEVRIQGDSDDIHARMLLLGTQAGPRVSPWPEDPARTRGSKP